MRLSMKCHRWFFAAIAIYMVDKLMKRIIGTIIGYAGKMFLALNFDNRELQNVT